MRLTCFSLLVAILGAGPKVEPPVAAPSNGWIELEGKSTESLTVEGRNGIQRVLERPGSHVPLPAGEYRLRGVQLQGGYHWQLLPGAEEPWFRVDAGATHKVEAGVPLRPHATASPGAGYLVLDADLRDAAGRKYGGPRQGNPPRFVVTKNGREVGSGSFEYG